jgi:hypothetical protein
MTVCLQVQVGLEQLIAEPDEFETWSGAIRDRLINKSMTNDGLQLATQLILEMVYSCLKHLFVYRLFRRCLARMCSTISPNFASIYRIRLIKRMAVILSTFVRNFFYHNCAFYIPKSVGISIRRNYRISHIFSPKYLLILKR